MACKGLWQTITVYSFAWSGAFSEGTWGSVAADEFDDELIVIGELWEGRSQPQHWAPITRKRNAPQPHPPVSDSWAKRDTKIWTGIASFRDSRCGRTLFNMFTKADNPRRVVAGVVQQNLEGDLGCLESYCELMGKKSGTRACPFRENILILEVDAREAEGPCWGRHLQTYLLADEEFCMQTDSHMDFVESWDTLMMAEWKATQNEYGVLSTYVQDVENLGKNIGKRWEVGHLCEVMFPASKQPRNHQARAIHDMTEPKLTTTWGAGFSFSKCHAERAVPYDPYLNQIFDGEEFSKMARLWTHGYDVYTPRRGIVFHDYSSHNYDKRSSWRNTSNKGEKQAMANQRLWNLLEMPGFDEEGREQVQGGPWGLGDRRSLDQFIEFTAVDLRTKSWIGITGNRCGSGVEWVPYDLDESCDSFTSWRTRENKEPISAGPRWQEVKERLKASGVDAWWADAVQSGSSPHRDLAPPERAPPEIPSVLVIDPRLDGGATHSVPASAESAKSSNGGSVSWMVFAGLWVLSCGMIVVVGFMGRRRSRSNSSSRRRRSRRKKPARRRQDLFDWSGDAFTVPKDTLFPIGAKSLSGNVPARKDR